jgi:hypothetical protein
MLVAACGNGSADPSRAPAIAARPRPHRSPCFAAASADRGVHPDRSGTSPPPPGARWTFNFGPSATLAAQINAAHRPMSSAAATPGHQGRTVTTPAEPPPPDDFVANSAADRRAGRATRRRSPGLPDFADESRTIAPLCAAGTRASRGREGVRSAGISPEAGHAGAGRQGGPGQGGRRRGGCRAWSTGRTCSPAAGDGRGDRLPGVGRRPSTAYPIAVLTASREPPAPLRPSSTTSARPRARPC